MVSLVSVIEKEIRLAGGWIGFDVFMQRALYEPNLGYYSGGGRPFPAASGAPPEGQANPPNRGDFVTGPMLGPWLARGVWSVWQELQRVQPGGCELREFGAGRGDLAAALMRLAHEEGQPLSIELIELSADLRESQKRLTERFVSGQQTIRWSSQLAPGFSGLVFGNEVLDAMPVKVFEWLGDQEVSEWGVELNPADQGGAEPFRWACRPAGPELQQAVLQRQQEMATQGFHWPKGYRGEWCLWISPWLRSLYESMDWGAVLLIDYGFARHELDHPGRSNGSICAHFQHRRLDAPEELLQAPGTRDLTAHVDFSNTAFQATAAGFSVDGLVTQSRFLMSLGLLDHAQSVLDQTQDVIERTKLAQSLQMLLLESEMGEVFKVMLLTKNLAPDQIKGIVDLGFASGDRLAGLMREP